MKTMQENYLKLMIIQFRRLKNVSVSLLPNVPLDALPHAATSPTTVATFTQRMASSNESENGQKQIQKLLSNNTVHL